MSLEDIKKDPFIKSLLDEGGTEQPSGRFTHNIIDTIKAQAKANPFVYKPVISRNAWLVIAILGVSIFIYLMFGTAPETQGLNLYGYSLNIDASKIQGFLSKIAISFTLTPIIKTSFAALFFFTFTNLVIFELKSRSFFK